MGTSDQIRALDDLVNIVSYFDRDVGVLAREGLLLVKELVEAGVDEPADKVRDLRARIRDDWRAALAAKFPGG